MKRVVVFTVFSICSLISFHSIAQAPAPNDKRPDNASSFSAEIEESYTFSNNIYSYSNLEDDLEALDNSFIRNHPICTEVARRLHLFEETYTYSGEAPPGVISDQKPVQIIESIN